MRWQSFFCLLLTALTVSTVRADGLTDMRGLALQHVKLPFYKNHKLQLVTFTFSGKRMGQSIYCNDMLLDVLLENADVDKIPDGWKIPLYPLDAELPEVLDFWKTRHLNSKAVVATTRCSINQIRSEATGDDPVLVRTPMFDLNGRGFHADFKKSVIVINSDVFIVARKVDADPRKLLAGAPMPKEYHLIEAASDTLRIDMENNEIMLIGNVRVVDGLTMLTCDRLTVFMSDDDKASGKNNSGKKVQGNDEAPMLKGVDRVLADGNVVLTGYPENPAETDKIQTATGDHLEYEVKSGFIVLTGTDNQPLVSQGGDHIAGDRIEILRDKNKVFVTGNCKVSSETRDADGKKSGVRTIVSQRADFDGNTKVSVFNGNVVAGDGATEMRCQNLRIYISKAEKKQDVERIFAQGNVRITSRSEKKDPAARGGKKNTVSTIISHQAELNYLTNKLVFYGKVRAWDATSVLFCNQLDIFLVDKKSAEQQVSSAPIGGGMGGKDKSIKKLTASGKVVMNTRGDKMSTDLMNLYFRDLPQGEKPSPGMFQSGGVQLTEILCDGSVTAVSKEKDGSLRILRADHAKSDLLRDYTEFHRNVSVKSGDNVIYSRDMYVFTARSSHDGAPVPPPPVKAKNPLDDDPFAMDMGENSVPSRIALSKDIDLTRIVCRNEVVLVRRHQGEIQRAGGDNAVYNVAKKEMVLTAKAPRRPWLRAHGRKQVCDVIRSNMETEELRGIGNVVVVPDDGK